jgi:hypothetical protein
VEAAAVPAAAADTKIFLRSKKADGEKTVRFLIRVIEN